MIDHDLTTQAAMMGAVELQPCTQTQQVVAYRYWDADANFGKGAWDYIDGPDDYCYARPDNFEPLTPLDITQKPTE